MKKKEQLAMARKIVEIRSLQLQRVRFEGIRLQQLQAAAQHRSDDAAGRVENYEQHGQRLTRQAAGLAPEALLNLAAALDGAYVRWRAAARELEKTASALEVFRQLLADSQRQLDSSDQLMRIARRKVQRELDEQQSARAEDLYLSRGVGQR